MAGRNGRPAEDHRRVRCIDTGTEYENYRDAAEAIGCDAASMYQCVSPRYGRRKCKGLRFEYIFDEQGQSGT